MQTIRWGLIGCGDISEKRVAPAMRDLPGPPTRIERLGWGTFDFANSAFNTLVVTFVYSAFFVGTITGDSADGSRGDALWGWMLTVSSVRIR